MSDDTNSMEGIHIPVGWTHRYFSMYGVVVTYPGKGSVTINFQRRSFTSGFSHVRFKNEICRLVHGGRGWKQKLVDDAVEWLLDAHGAQVPSKISDQVRQNQGVQR